MHFWMSWAALKVQMLIDQYLGQSVCWLVCLSDSFIRKVPRGDFDRFNTSENRDRSDDFEWSTSNDKSDSISSSASRDSSASSEISSISDSSDYIKLKKEKEKI